ncbi:hypothetical protein MMC07_000988 [Pseudocyphellaria aurata]|nr:hypothetical protein [Pseudocyphellaria aurata]
MTTLVLIPTLFLVPEFDVAVVLWEPVGVPEETRDVEGGPELSDVIVLFTPADEVVTEEGLTPLEDEELALEEDLCLVEDEGVALNVVSDTSSTVVFKERDVNVSAPSQQSPEKSGSQQYTPDPSTRGWHYNSQGFSKSSAMVSENVFRGVLFPGLWQLTIDAAPRAQFRPEGFIAASTAVDKTVFGGTEAILNTALSKLKAG